MDIKRGAICLVILCTVFLMVGGNVLCQDKIELEVSSWIYFAADERQPFVEWTQAFEKEHPNITIKHIGISYQDYWDKLTVAIAGNNEADVVFMDHFLIPGYQSMREGGTFEVLDDYIAATDLPESIFSLDIQKYDGHYLALPYAWMTLSNFYYNKKRFDELSINASEVKTWDDFRNICAKLTRDIDGDGKIDQYAQQFPNDLDANIRWWFQDWAWTLGGGFFKNEQPPYTTDNLIFNSDANVEALTFLTEIQNDYAPSGIRGVYDTRQLFYTGQTAMELDGPWLVQMTKTNAPDLDFDLMQIPGANWQGKFFEPVASRWSISMLISKLCKNKKEAFELIKFIDGEVAQRSVLATLPPVNKNVFQNEYKASNPLAFKYMDMSSTLKSSMVPGIPQWYQLDKIAPSTLEAS